MSDKKRNRIFVDHELARNASGLFVCLYDNKTFQVAGSLENHLKKKYGYPLSHYLVDVKLAPSKDYILCRECSLYIKVVASHIKSSHNMSVDEYKSKHDDAPLYSASTILSFSNNMKGVKNPNHKSKTTIEQRQSISPNSIVFYEKKYPDLSHTEHLAMLSAHANKITDNRVTATQLEYYLRDGISVEDAKAQLSIRQSTFSLDKCIEKHGEQAGRLVHQKRQQKWQDTLAENGNLKSGYSLVSQTLFYELLGQHHIHERKNIYFEGKSKEYFITESRDGVKHHYKYDYTDRLRMKIVEFNGDIFHANPALYAATDRPNPYKKHLTSKDMWEYDALKAEVANRHGFEVLTVWESDYRKHKQATIDQCVAFLRG